MKRFFKFILIGLVLMIPHISASAKSIYSIDFNGLDSVKNWSNAESVSFETDEIVGNYMIADGNIASEAPKTDTFEAGECVCVEFDMMLPSLKADGVTENTIFIIYQ